MLESNLQRHILNYLKPRCWVIKVIQANDRGCPDIIACIDGQFVGIEVKPPGEKPTAIQAAQHKAIEKAGGRVYIIHSLEELKKELTSSSRKT